MEKTKIRTKKLKVVIPELTEDNIEGVYNDHFEKINLNDDATYNSFLVKKEKLNSDYIESHENKYENLYPSLDDKNFNIKIASKKEFSETKYDGELYDIEEQAEKLCNADFELIPHQLFVNNFLYFQSPYNN